MITDGNIFQLVGAYLEGTLTEEQRQITGNRPIGEWDVSRVTDMQGLFGSGEDTPAARFNEPLNNWNVSNVIDMSEMFSNCRAFNQPLDKWNVSNVKRMDFMFFECRNFNQPLNTWNTSKVENIRDMFYGCDRFNQPQYADPPRILYECYRYSLLCCAGNRFKFRYKCKRKNSKS